MHKVVVTSVRTDSNIEFFKYDSDMYDYIDEEYVQPGRLFVMKVSLSNDRLTEYCEMMFENKQAWQAFSKDPVIYYQEPIKVRYNIYHKIAVSTNTEEIVVTKDLYNLYLR
jgi:hypothetical protein